MNQKEATSKKKEPQPEVHYEQISVRENSNISLMIDQLEQQITECFSQEKYHLAIDMSAFPLIPKRMIVLLIQATSQARRLCGDIQLKKLKPMVRNNLVTFLPRTVLSMEASEEFAMLDFGEKIEVKSSPVDTEKIENEAIPKNEDTADSPELQKKPVVDIYDTLNTLNLNDSNKVRVSSSQKNLYQICDFVLLKAKKAGFDEHALAKLKVTTYEASLNVIEHAYYSNPDYWIDVYAVKSENKFYIMIHDWGRSFDFDPGQKYDVQEAVKERKAGGFGLHIIKRSVDEIHYLADQKVGNRLILIKEIVRKSAEKNEDE